jgi:erythromycin esterase
MLRTSFLVPLCVALVAQAPLPIPVEGRVLEADGHPLGGAIVGLNAVAEGSGISSIPEQKTDAKGHFLLKAPAGRYGLTVTAPGHEPHFRNIDLKAETPLPPVEVRLEKGGYRIQGRLLSENGGTLEGSRVAFSRISEDSGDRFFAAVQRGHFEITLASGDYLAFAEAKGQSGGQRFEVRGNQPNAFIQLRPEPTPADPQTLAWIKGHAIPLKGVEAGKGFADMQPLKALVGEATVVGLGEATHGTREFFQLKHRMLEFLVMEKGFTVFAIEANLPEAFAVNEYVLTGQGDPAKALAGLYFWTWNTEEVLDMIRWMRAYNEDPAHPAKLRFYGVDMQTETVAYDQAKAWLDAVNPAEASNLLRIKEGMAKLPSNFEQKPTEESLKAWDSAAKAVEALIVRLEAQKLAGDDFDRQRQNLRVLAQFAAMQADAAGGFKARDASMAANLRWIQEREHGAKIVLWAHNAHIDYRPGSRGFNAMGWHLRQSLGKAYLPIGFAFREGEFQAKSGDPSKKGLQVFEVKPQAMGTLDAALASAGHPILALDLRNRPKAGRVKRWLESPQGTWSIGAVFTPGGERGFLAKTPITQSYDALLYMDHTTRARPVAPAVKAVASKRAVNLSFEGGMVGWSTPKGPYRASVVDRDPKEGGHCLEIAFEGAPNPEAWGSSTQAMDATAFRGKRVRLTGWIRTDGKPDFTAVYWVRVDCASGMGFFDNMNQRPVTGTAWTEVTIEGPVARDAVNLNFGCMVFGMGSAWFDGIRVEALP